MRRHDFLPTVANAAHRSLPARIVWQQQVACRRAVALLTAAICSMVLSRTPLGYAIRDLGYNPEALRHKGVNIGRTVTIILMASRALAALAGAIELFGVAHRLRADNLVRLGYAGIIVGMIGGLRPLGTVMAGLFFGGLASGAVYMRVLGDVPAALVPAIQGISLWLRPFLPTTWMPDVVFSAKSGQSLVSLIARFTPLGERLSMSWGMRDIV
ncbi:ABC transporter permease [Mesorhizobium sp. B2-5-5]|uniref:ABC transporter permease subunit n=1 Tax=unclassified Mesorhizobium TaxID=325217 RepID=UPI0011296D06|nr:ABC transporter permease [Mesorhizobium sp. B2-5-5]